MMAISTDIRVSTRFPSDLKILDLTSTYGDGAAFWLIKLWIYAAVHRPLGDLHGISSRQINVITGATVPDFADALCEHDLLHKKSNGIYSIVSWEKNQQWVIDAPKRSEKAAKAASDRWKDHVKKVVL